MRTKEKDIYSQIRQEELTADLDLIAEIIGLDNTVKLIRDLQGISVYIPKITRLDGFIARFLKENREMTTKQIALQLGVSEIFLKNFIQKQK